MISFYWGLSSLAELHCTSRLCGNLVTELTRHKTDDEGFGAYVEGRVDATFYYGFSMIVC